MTHPPINSLLPCIRWVLLTISVGFNLLNAASQEVVVQRTQASDTISVAVNATETLLASAAYGAHSVTVWDLRSRRQMRTVPLEGEVSNIAISPDGAILAAATTDCTVSLFDPQSGASVKTLQSKAADIQFDWDAGKFSTSDQGNGPQEGSPMMRPVNFQMPLAFGRNGDLAAATPFTSEGNIYWAISIWDSKSKIKDRLFQPDAHDQITSLAFSPDGQWVADGRFDGSIEVWELSTRKRLKLVHSDTIGLSPTQIVIDPSKSLLVASSYEVVETEVIDLKSDHVQKLPFQSVTAAFSEDGSMLMLGTDHAIMFLNPLTLSETRGQLPIGTKGEFVRTITPLQHGLYIATAARNFFVVTTAGVQPLPLFESRAKPIGPLAFLQGNSTLLVAREDRMREWDLKSGRLLSTIKLGDGSVNSILVSPDNTRLIELSTQPDSPDSHELLQEFALPAGTPLWSRTFVGAESPCINPSGTHLAILEKRGMVDILDPNTGETTRQIRIADGLGSSPAPDFGQDVASVVYSIAFVDDALIAATGTNPSRATKATSTSTLPNGGTMTISEVDTDSNLPALQVWDIVNNQRVFSKATQDPPLLAGPMAAIAASPSSGLVATSYPEGVAVHLWDIKRGIEEEPLKLQGALLRFNHSGSLFACADSVGNIFVQEISTGKQREIPGTRSSVTELEFSPDDKTLIVGTEDGSIELWNISDFKLKASLFLSGDRSFIITPDNYYFADHGLFDFISFVYQNRAYSVDQFDLKFNRPDKVLGQLGADQQVVKAYEHAYEDRVERMSKSPFNEEVSPPIVRVDSDLPIYTKGRTIEAKIHASDAKTELASFQVYDNGVPIFGAQGISISSRHEHSYSATIPIELMAGTNHLQFAAVNRDGVESLRQPVDVTLDVVPREAHVILIAIGISNYLDKTQALNYPAKDATDFGQYFAKMWPAEMIRQPMILVDGQAKRTAILDLKGSILKATNPDDIVVMLMAGHGVLDEHLKYFFAPYDMDFRHSDQRGLSLDDIEHLFDGVPARRRLLLLDTCHAGDLEFARSSNTPSRAGGVTVLRPSSLPPDLSKIALDEAFINLRHGAGLFVIGAAGGAQTAVERGDLKNGAFTFAVLEALGRIAPGDVSVQRSFDGTLSVSQLRDYVGAKVVTLTSGQQTPLLWSGPDEYDFQIVH